MIHIVEDLFNTYKIDHKTLWHSRKTGLIASMIAASLGMTKRDILRLKTLGTAHDIGKVMIFEVINIARQLTEDEKTKVRLHPMISEKILKLNNFSDEDSKIVRWHHERLDGSGYPDGLKNYQIPIESQIISVADVYSALTNKRVYRDVQYGHQEAILIMRNDHGLNLKYVEILNKLLSTRHYRRCGEDNQKNIVYREA